MLGDVTPSGGKDNGGLFEVETKQHQDKRRGIIIEPRANTLEGAGVNLDPAEREKFVDETEKKPVKWT
ncbi:hypothetical protein RRG08_040197 [Elysia crispata]|uniref:Uncharacterized protein n=1 Tax=Elysia crispata TaxID=231223 RepID=A0AAE0XXI9_9GAST|nr:hypothetical protein RRG08_040197 [Elysia crispata]